MPNRLDPGRLDSAMQRFRDFFSELRETFVERDAVLTQCELALLCRQHVLMTGPPGTAKSQLASLVLGRILDENTGKPSLFARQFTESTVQTDLVGPINFKTLMETGRTEHFTDEGILGSVHAFLDEVFDGRDMLLRSTLNLLHERELKQGGETARGNIESAFMTSNRYISEILDGSRETMLAFIDRISFISFVPRGFANADNLALVVRRHGGGFGRHVPTAALTVQDLDVLQRAVELTYVPEQMCDAVTELLGHLDQELAAARRADPRFQPTRYLSTRTAVQATGVLRAIAVRDKIFANHGRALEVGHDDLGGLRYNLVLAGLDRGAVAARMDVESDPRERRQLDIMRTESEIFDRCLARVPRRPVSARPPEVSSEALRKTVDTVRSAGDPAAVLAAVRELVTAAESGAPGADQAAQLLIEAVGALSEHALRAGLTPALAGDDLGALTEELVAVADNLERAGAGSRPMAVWLRGRLLTLIDESLLLAPVSHESLEALVGEPDDSALAAQIEARLAAVERLYGVRNALDSGGAVFRQSERSADVWETALGKLDDELALLLDARFRLAASRLLGGAGAADRPLADLLGELAPFTRSVERVVARIADLGGDSRLEQRVMGLRLEPLIERAFERLDGRDRRAAISTAESVVGKLERVGLAAIMTPERFVNWMVRPLVRDESARAAERTPVASRADYDAARAREAALSMTEALVHIAILALPHAQRRADEPEVATEAIYDVLRQLDERRREEVISADLGRIERGIEALESWWESLASGDDDATDEAVGRLERVVESGFLRLIRGNPPLKLALECSQLESVFPSCADRAQALRERLEGLDAASTQFLVTMLETRSDRAWAAALDPE